MAASRVGLGSGVDVDRGSDTGVGVEGEEGSDPPHAFRKSTLTINRKRLLLIVAPHSLVGAIIGEAQALYTPPARDIFLSSCSYFVVTFTNVKSAGF
jgi:hypothetical protein